ncbi:MAG: TonB-dependent receptor [Halioglobus sp.]
MKRSIPVIAPALLLAALPIVVFAQQQPEVENTLVTGSYAPSARLTSSVSVLTAEDIRALNKRNVVGLLKTLPGLLVEQQGGPGGLTAVSIRGAESNFTLVLLDGVPVNDPTNFRGGGYDFSNLNPAMVERIEVVRGPQSAIYGSDALGGVINIITRRAEEGHSQTAQYEHGEDGYYNLGFSALGTLGDLEYGIDIAQRDDGEPVEGSTRDSDSANLRLQWRMGGVHSLSASYHYLDGERTSYPEQGGGPEFSVTSDLDLSDYTDSVLALGWQADFSPIWRSTLRASRFDHEESYYSPGIFPYEDVPPNAADTDFQRDQLQWVNTLNVTQDYQFNLGVDYRQEEGESLGYLEFFGFPLPTDFELDRSTRGVFADTSISAIDDLLLQASIRYDDPDDFDGETTYHFGGSYDLGRGVSLSANWGKAFKLPSFFALGHALVGNPDLQPERATSWDLGLAWDTSATLRLELGYFFNDFEDLVDFDDETFKNVNRSQIETSGYEFHFNWQALEALSLQGQATYTDIDTLGEDTILTGRPEWTAGAVAQWQISPLWDTALDYQWTGEQFAGSRHTGDLVYTELDDYHRVDWVLRWQPVASLQLQLSLDNLLDEEYETSVGFPAPGRAARLGIRFSHR